MYKNVIKPTIDFILALIGTVVFALPMIVVALLIVIDDPGPVLFKQKRVGQKRNGELTYFDFYKFRSMKMSTPHDVPTHMLENPEQYITRIGKICRKYSLDELIQIPTGILTGKISIVGPRPALWNQYDLIKEREKYGANDIKPGLTGWAQINGRDELSIEDKARFDGNYVKYMGVKRDLMCFLGTIGAVIDSQGVVEGRTDSIDTTTKNVSCENLHLIPTAQLKKEIIMGGVVMVAVVPLVAIIVGYII